MAATKADRDRWIEEAKQKGAKFVVSVCDTFDYDDFPVYVMPTDNLEEVLSRYQYTGLSMFRVNEAIEIK